MKSTKKVLLKIMLLSIILIGVLIPNKAYASSDKDFVIEEGVLIKYQGAGGDVVIPEGVTKIGKSSFSSRDKLTSIKIPNSVIEIGNFAFNDCKKLTKIEIPDTATTIGYDAFLGTPWLDKKRSELKDHLVIINHILIDGKKAQGKVTIPDGVTIIKDYSLVNNYKITSVKIPNSVIEIGENAFWGCKKLTEIEIPDSVTTIVPSAFSGTPWLEKKQTERKDHLVIINNILIDGKKAQGKVIIPDGVTVIGEESFDNCDKLTSVKISNSVIEIGKYAFYNCKKLTEIEIPDNVTTLSATAFSGTPWLEKKQTESKNHLVIINNILIDGKKAQGKVTIPDGVTVIGIDSFFANNKITSVKIPNSVIEIESHAFNACVKLTNVEIPDSVTAIGEEAFGSCMNLNDFTIPKDVTKLGLCILDESYRLKKLTILNKKLKLIETDNHYGNYLTLTPLIGETFIPDEGTMGRELNRTLTIYGYKYSTADELAVRLNTLKATGKMFGIKSVKFVPLDKSNNTLDTIKVPKSITIKKNKSKKLLITLPSTLKRVKKFTKEQGQVKISITYTKEILNDYGNFYYKMTQVSNDTIKATETGTGYAYTTVSLPNGDKKVFATKVIVK